MGKTTLVRAIAGVVPPEIEGGSIKYRGRELIGLESYEISILLVEQNVGLAVRLGDRFEFMAEQGEIVWGGPRPSSRRAKTWRRPISGSSVLGHG